MSKQGYETGSMALNSRLGSIQCRKLAQRKNETDSFLGVRK